MVDKKEVYQRVNVILVKELRTVRNKIAMNKRTFAQLRKEQTILKRERAELDKMIREIEK